MIKSENLFTAVVKCISTLRLKEQRKDSMMSLFAESKVSVHSHSKESSKQWNSIKTPKSLGHKKRLKMLGHGNMFNPD
jgi:hypothetical protein